MPARDTLKMGAAMKRHMRGGAAHVSLPIYPDVCCGSPDDVFESSVAGVPRQLRQAGVSQGDWSTWVARLRAAVLEHATSQCTAWAAFISCCGIPYVELRRKARRRAVEAVVAAMNAELLAPVGAAAALRHVLYSRPNPDAVTLYKGTWLAIALGEQAVAELRAEAGVVAESCWPCCECCASGGI